jgi:hypothetical protein
MSIVDSACIRITFSFEGEIEVGMWKHFENEGKNFFVAVIAVYTVRSPDEETAF